MIRRTERTLLHRLVLRGAATFSLVSVVPVLIGVLLVCSAVPKIRSPWVWYRVLLAYDVLPDALTRAVAVVVPWMEATIAAALIFGLLRRAALAASVVMFAGFAVAQLSVLARGLVVECGCFSISGGSPVGAWTLGRALLLSCVAGAAFVASKKRKLEGRRLSCEGSCDE